MTDTKSEIVKIATALILEKGYNAFSYADIAKTLHIRNAAIHYHFPTKEDLAVAVMKAQQEGLKGLIQELKRKNTSEIEQIHALFDIYTGLLEQKQICALGSMGADIRTLAPQVQVEVKNDYELAIGWLVNILTTGREKGIFKFEEDATIQASIIINNLIAGIIVARFNGFDKGTFKRVLNQLLAEIT
jgi:AcrR family transcriptional regulator